MSCIFKIISQGIGKLKRTLLEQKRTILTLKDGANQVFCGPNQRVRVSSVWAMTHDIQLMAAW